MGPNIWEQELIVLAWAKAKKGDDDADKRVPDN
jgi:hypothetical protein